MILVLKALGATGTSTLANFSALLCYYLMGCAAIAIGVFLSSLTENQIIAAVSGVAALLLAYMMPSLRTMFTTGSAVALALFTAIAAVLSVVAGLRSKSFTLGCLSFAGSLRGAYGTVSAQEQLADRGFQRSAQRTVPVYPL